jgi:uncharacterized protein involved in exopolysaccharide biosynthesis
MIERLLETFFRHKLLILAPPVLIVAIVTPIALMTMPTYYEAHAGVWVDRPTWLNVPVDETTRYLTPNAAQAVQLTELLRTRSFLLDVASRTGLAPLTATTAGQDRAAQIVATSVAVASPGNHLLVIGSRSASPELAYQLVNAVFEAFRDKATSDRLGQAELAISFYESRLKSAQDDVTKSSDALRRYVATTSRNTGVDAPGGNASRLGLPAAATDPQLGQIMRQADTDQREVERLNAALEQARLDVSASLEGQELGFQMVDNAAIPQSPTRERRKVLLYPAAGLLLGLVLGATLLILLVATDAAARTESDLIARARVLGVVPKLQMKTPKRGAPEQARRAIGFVAGTALPAPSGGQP